MAQLLEKWVQNPSLFFLCLENICMSIYLITSFINGYIQHLNVIFESENKHGRNVVVITFEWKKKTAWPVTHVTNIPNSLSCLPYLEKHKQVIFLFKVWKICVKEWKADISWRTIVQVDCCTITESYRYFKIQ